MTASMVPVGRSFTLPTPLRFPAILRRPDPPAPAPEVITVDIHRQPEWAALDWQLAIRDLWRDHPTLCPSFKDKLKATGLLPRCCFLASLDNGPLIFRYIGEPTIAFLGREWARYQLGKPDLDDPHQTLAEGVGAQYREAIEGGAPVFNRVMITGLSAEPKIYTHLLLGWRLPDGNRALLSCLDD
ncbi:hypothetical protein GAY33_05315 [Azospirillum brasilense]|uniref:hypothetical protein n=1 Tax=Azospirillum argentinense TaxID=2970906 RepID=UPI00190BFB78|nr:hypothetical protein [Azospirillum argentinense]MBK3798655.1 hypothetical protein [Azospirillum argentinense]